MITGGAVRASGDFTMAESGVNDFTHFVFLNKVFVKALDKVYGDDILVIDKRLGAPLT